MCVCVRRGDVCVFTCGCKCCMLLLVFMCIMSALCVCVARIFVCMSVWLTVCLFQCLCLLHVVLVVWVGCECLDQYCVCVAAVCVGMVVGLVGLVLLSCWRVSPNVYTWWT